MSTYPDFVSFKVGLAVARTHPLHNGHCYLLNEMLRRCAKSYWFIGSSDKSRTEECPYTAAERVSFIATLYSREICEGKLIIKQVKDLGNMDKWGDYILSQVPENVDAYFAGTEKDAFPFLKHKIHIENLRRELVYSCKSGTELRKMIRENNNEWYHYVPSKIWELIDAYNTLMGEGYDYK